ncbi:MAG: glycerophosphodiester phosphodiesterase family protein, partial [Bacteroidales bacterium]
MMIKPETYLSILNSKMKQIIIMRSTYIFLVIFIGMCYSCKQEPNTKIIAHRGASGYVTENTVPAVEKAVELNSDAVEVDIWRTTDDSLIVFHDRNTARLAEDSLVIPGSNYKELRKLRLNGGTYIPTLRSVLKILPSDTEIFIEIKCCWEEGEAGQVFPMLGDLLKETGTVEQATLISFNMESLIEAKEYVQEVPLYWLTSEQQPVSELINKVTDAGISGLNVHHSLVSGELMDQVRAQNMDVYVWTVNDTERAAALAGNYGVDGITTDYPD